MANLPFTILNLGGRVSALQVLSSSKVVCSYGLKSPSKFSLRTSRLMGLQAVVPMATSTTDAKAHHNHSTHWTAEKVLSVSLIGLIPAALACPSAPLNYALALSLTMHAHWGLEAIVVDYVRPSIFGETIPKLGVGLLYALSIAAFGGLCYFNYSDVGLAQAVLMLWKL